MWILFEVEFGFEMKSGQVETLKGQIEPELQTIIVEKIVISTPHVVL